MIYKVSNEQEYFGTLQVIKNLGIYDDNLFDYLTSGSSLPDKYPAIIMLDIEVYDDFTIIPNIEYVYPEDILSGNEVQGKLYDLDILNSKLDDLQNLMDTSGIIDKPLEVLADTQEQIDAIENQLF